MADAESTIVLGLSPRVAQIVAQAMIVESEGPASDNRSEEEIKMIEAVITEIDSQMPKKGKA